MQILLETLFGGTTEEINADAAIGLWRTAKVGKKCVGRPRGIDAYDVGARNPTAFESQLQMHRTSGAT